MQPQAGARAEQVLRRSRRARARRAKRRRAVDVVRDARVVAAAHQRAQREVDERAGGVVVVAGRDGERERLLEQRAARARRRRALDSAEPTFVSAWATVSSSPMRRASALGARPERDRLVVALVEHRELRAAAQRHRQLAAVGEGLEHRDRPVAGGDGLLAASRPPQQARQPAQVVADAQRVARRLVDREQGAARLGRARSTCPQR